MEVVITTHAYIDKYPIKPTDKYLILGTIHPHNVECFEIDFFYGNENTLWNIINKACGILLIDLKQILFFLQKNHIAISDMILECERDNRNITQDKKIRPTKFNLALKDQIKNSQIDTIFFTSTFSAKLFFDTFKTFINTHFKTLDETREFDILFDSRKIHCIVLYSPSGQALFGIAKGKTYKNAKTVNCKLSVEKFRVEFYQSKFCALLNNYTLKD